MAARRDARRRASRRVGRAVRGGVDSRSVRASGVARPRARHALASARCRTAGRIVLDGTTSDMNPASLTLSLVSHTNVGKTTLARTLLGHDVGEVRDRAHVTIDATEYTMHELSSGEALKLWDTPGFGDSV